MENNYTLGFLVQSPFHYYLYDSIIDHLVEKNIKCHLLINDTIENDEEWGEMYKSLIKFIEKIDREDIDAFLLSTVKNVGFQYDGIVSPYYTEELKGLARKNIRLMYSLAKENWTYSWWNILYDKILCYGEYDFEKLNIYNNCVIIGNPKFDKWFKLNCPSDNNQIIEQYDLHIDKNKQTILYVPTYGDLSSIDLWIDDLKRLKNNYNIIVKLHHGTSYLKSEKYRRDNLFSNVLDDSVDILNILRITDYLISDYSGIIFDAMLAETNILLLNIQSNNKFSDERSLEVVIRNEIINIDKGIQIETVLQNEGKLTEQRNKLQELANSYYSFQDGSSGERAALEIIKELRKQGSPDNRLLMSLREKLNSL